ncbi:hypothetical protein EVAR_60721_1 [Eumeta japonica]|uniref:Uncharacterized protein n=1 Tax=Eumeta variegata TaxID=151549 RepID=A0A4C1S8W9_EUMVA|nr:hypothetical protein EVAR_60721_1 [Eumeta japonica]
MDAEETVAIEKAVEATLNPTLNFDTGPALGLGLNSGLASHPYPTYSPTLILLDSNSNPGCAPVMPVTSQF